jgi:tetratricopeptide (TPR) repeat protein
MAGRYKMTSSDWKNALQKVKVVPVREEQITEDEFLSFEDMVPVKRDALQRTLQRTLSELEELVRENRWDDILAIAYPLEEKLPELVESGLDSEVRAKAAFALGQLMRFDDAIQELSLCVKREPDRFLFHSSLAYNAYNSLYAASNREIFLRGRPRHERIALAHRHFKRAQELRPDGITNFYRQGMLFKQIEKKTEKSIRLFEAAVSNWDRMNEERKKTRTQERKNYIKALYQLASALLERGLPEKALQMLRRCLVEDEKTEYVSLVYKYFALGKVHFQLNEFAEAKDALDFAATCKADRPMDFVYELLARTFLALNDAPGAADTINRVPEKKRRPYYRWTEADVLCALRDFQGARRVLLQSMERDKRSGHKALIRLARIEYLGADFHKSMRYAKAAGEFFHEAWGGILDDAVFWQALNAYRLDDHEKATELATDLKERNPRYPKLDVLLAGLSRNDLGSTREHQ